MVDFRRKMPIVRRERHRSNSSSPKLPSRTLSPRNAASASTSSGHRLQPDAAGMISKAHGRNSHAQRTTTTNAVNNALVDNNSRSNSPSLSSSEAVSPAAATVLPSASSVTPLGMSLRNHSRNILGQSLRQDEPTLPLPATGITIWNF